jgi:hypothetical protein
MAKYCFFKDIRRLAVGGESRVYPRNLQFNPSPAMYPETLQSITGVEFVNLVG